jgi:hypothetical protein
MGRVTIDVLPDVALLNKMARGCSWVTTSPESLTFGPCTTRTPVKDMLGIRPLLPIAVWGMATKRDASITSEGRNEDKKVTKKHPDLCFMRIPLRWLVALCGDGEELLWCPAHCSGGSGLLKLKEKIP